MKPAITAPDHIDLAFIRKVAMALSWQDPVAPNAIYQCLVWANLRISELERKLVDIAELAMTKDA